MAREALMCGIQIIQSLYRDCRILAKGENIMINYVTDYKYIENDGLKLFTVILLPEPTGKFPVVIVRNPYVDSYEYEKEENVAIAYLNENKEWLNRGYAVVIQHCRGRGKSEGDCVPYINEREDGLSLQEWVRKQSFYNGEIFLKGGRTDYNVKCNTCKNK